MTRSNISDTWHGVQDGLDAQLRVGGQQSQEGGVDLVQVHRRAVGGTVVRLNRVQKSARVTTAAVKVRKMMGRLEKASRNKRTKLGVFCCTMSQRPVRHRYSSRLVIFTRFECIGVPSCRISRCEYYIMHFPFFSIVTIQGLCILLDCTNHPAHTFNQDVCICNINTSRVVSRTHVYGVIKRGGGGVGFAEGQGAKHPVVVAVGERRKLRIELSRGGV